MVKKQLRTQLGHELMLPVKIERPAQWCQDANNRQKKITYKMLYVKKEDWEKYRPKNWKELVSAFFKKDTQRVVAANR